MASLRAPVRAALVALSLLATRAALASPPVERLDLTPAQWREDLAAFARELPRRHGNAFSFTPRERFDAAVAELDRGLDRMNPDEAYVGLDRIANLIGDGHTCVRFPVDTPGFPLRFARFGEDYRVVAATSGLEPALGARLVGIAGTPVDSVRGLMLPLTPVNENPPLREAQLTGYLSNAVMLHGLGICARRDSVRYVLADTAGREWPLDVAAVPDDRDPGWVRVSREAPLYHWNPGETFWTKWLPESRTVYCSFRGYRDLGKHARRLFKELDQRQPEKLVIDLRQNGGGDYTLGERKLIKPIAARPGTNLRGHLFVLVGAQTFSAAMNNAAQFRSLTAALLVGQTIGEKPNSWQEPREMRLPNSHLRVRYSTRFYEFAKAGENVIRPDHEIETTWDDFQAGRDPVLEWVLAYPDTAAGR